MALVNTKKSTLLLASGATTPTPANFLEVTEPIIISPEINGGEYSRITGQLNTGNQRYNDLNFVTASFTANCYMRASNVAGTALDTPPEIANALKVSGLDETIDTTVAGSEFIEYTNSQSPIGGSSIVYVDGKKYTFESGGVVANPSFSFTIGEPAQANFEVQGFLTSPVPTDEANPSVTKTEEPLLIVSGINVLTVGGTTIKADSVEITPNNTIEDFYTLGGASGLKDKEIVDNGYTMTVTFFVDSTSFDTDYTLLENQNLQSVDLKLGTDASGVLVNGKSLNITCGSAEVQQVQDDTDRDRVKRTVTYRLQNDSANDDTAITFRYGFFA